MGALLRLLIAAIAVLLMRSLLRFFVGGSRGRQAPVQSGSKEKGQMIRDPHCGTYVAAELAIPAMTGGRTLHFCSDSCRREYQKAHGS